MPYIVAAIFTALGGVLVVGVAIGLGIGIFVMS